MHTVSMVDEASKTIVKSVKDLETGLQPAFLLIENGMQFSGLSPKWQKGCFEGEVVFTTGMTGYDNSLTDPSYTGQILVFTYPLIGNYGVPGPEHWESEKIHAAGVVVSSVSLHWSHNKSLHSFLQWLENQQVPLITDIDTRHLTKILREKGTMLGAISNSEEQIQSFKDPNKVCLAEQASIHKKTTYGSHGKTIFLVDCGMKANILRSFQKHSLIIHRVPYNYDYSQEDFDGLFISNGPGDPQTYKETVAILRHAMEKKKPVFGICLGAQLMALAAGAKTYKLPYGHRGHNQPCLDVVTQKCFMTSQNHGYAIQEDSLPEGWKVNFRNLNDDTVEGIFHSTLPFFSVQFHPEAAPGPTDTEWLFKHFIDLI